MLYIKNAIKQLYNKFDYKIIDKKMKDLLYL